MKAGRHVRLALVLLLAAVALWFALQGRHWLDLAALKAAQADLQALVQARPLAAAGLFFAAYVAVGAFMLPGAGVMSVAAGALFGAWWGSLLALAAATAGATLALLEARYLLRDTLRWRFAAMLGVIDRGIERDGVFYLAALRLVPAIPFFVLNPAMGLTSMRVRTFVAVSALAMLPGALVHVVAGVQIAQVASLADLLSWPLGLSIAALVLFPLPARALLAAWRRRRVYRPWAHLKPRRFERDLVVVGAGAAGLVASLVAAAVKARVTLVEAGRMGGDCLNTGCVPSKALLHVAAEVQMARRWGATAAPDFARVMARVAQAVRALEPQDSAARYRALGVEVLQGRATLVDPWHVRVDVEGAAAQLISTRAVVVATGARPVLPDLPGLVDHAPLTSETLWSLPIGRSACWCWVGVRWAANWRRPSRAWAAW